MINRSRIVKSIFLVIGTSVGTGILALPSSMGSGGLIPAILTLVICFIFMSLGALYVTEVSLHLPRNTDFLTMAKSTIGPLGQYITMVVYTLLMYALTSMYLLVGSSWFIHSLQEAYNVSLSPTTALLFLISCIAPVIYNGMRAVGQLNQLCTSVFLIAFSALIADALPTIAPTNLLYIDGFDQNFRAFPLVITAFGFSIVMPTLTTHLNRQVRPIMFSLCIGGLSTLMAYIVWGITSFGVLGAHTLSALGTQKDNGTLLVLALEAYTASPWIGQCARLYVIFTVISSILAVTLSLYNFLKDALSLSNGLKDRITGILLTYSPPVLLLIIHPMGLGHILGLAGLFVAILLGILPAFMAYKLRTTPGKKVFKTPGGVTTIFLSIIFFLYIVCQELINLCR